MIKLTQKPDIPESLQVADVRDSLARISDKVQSGEPLTDKDFSSGIWRKKDVRPVLWEHHNGKCCYCERKRDPKGEPDVEHFRPKTKTTEDGNPGYWWLAYDWSNLFFSCKACNQKKVRTFPSAMSDKEPERLKMICPWKIHI